MPRLGGYGCCSWRNFGVTGLGIQQAERNRRARKSIFSTRNGFDARLSLNEASGGDAGGRRGAGRDAARDRALRLLLLLLVQAPPHEGRRAPHVHVSGHFRCANDMDAIGFACCVALAILDFACWLLLWVIWRWLSNAVRFCSCWLFACESGMIMAVSAQCTAGNTWSGCALASCRTS